MYAQISNAQAKCVIDAEQLHSALRDAIDKSVDYKGGMHWKTVSGKEYLYRQLDRKGNGKSLGPRSEKTEAMIEAFTSRKAELANRVAELKEKMRIQTKVNAAHRAGHVPNEVADICEQLNAASLLGKNMMVIGTNAMHAYEALAGIRFPSDIMATTDIDLLWNHTSKLSLAADEEVSKDGLLGILKKADRTYEVKKGQPFRAISQSGYMVDLIRQMPNPPWADEPDRFFETDLVATDICNMNWLLGAPHIIQPVIALDGRVVTMCAPDPRAYAMFKIWLSKAADREPGKKLRDAAQAQAVITMVEEHLPHLAAKWESLHSFPSDVTASAMTEVNLSRERSRG